MSFWQTYQCSLAFKLKLIANKISSYKFVLFTVNGCCKFDRNYVEAKFGIDLV